MSQRVSALPLGPLPAWALHCLLPTPRRPHMLTFLFFAGIFGGTLWLLMKDHKKLFPR